MSQLDLDALKYLKPARTRWFPLDSVWHHSPDVVELEIVHAGRSNAAFTSAMAKRADVGGPATSAAAMDELDRSSTIPLFSKHVIKNWRNVLGRDGQPVPFNQGHVETLLSALLDNGRSDLIQQLVRYAFDADNFRDEPIGSAAEELGKR